MRNRITDWPIWLSNSEPFVPLTAETISTIDDIMRVCPAVRRILNRARSIRQYRRTNWRDYESLKAKLAIYVGWHAEDQRLQSSRCYELCISALTKALDI